KAETRPGLLSSRPRSLDDGRDLPLHKRGADCHGLLTTACSGLAPQRPLMHVGLALAADAGRSIAPPIVCTLLIVNLCDSSSSQFLWSCRSFPPRSLRRHPSSTAINTCSVRQPPPLSREIQMRRESARGTLSNFSIQQAFSARSCCRWHTLGAKRVV